MPNPPPNELRLTVADANEWSAWLDREAETSSGIWVRLARKGTTMPTSLTWDQALDECLCHGWIDGQRYPVDETTYLQRYLPRRPMSMWSKRNVGHIARLESEGRMRPRGRQEVEKAKANGRWDTAYSQADLEPPAHLMAAIAAVPEAQAQWDILTKQNKFAICFRLAALKTVAGRQKRLQASVDMLARGETLHPQKRVRESATKSSPKAPRKVTKPKATKGTSTKAPNPQVAEADPSRRRSGRLIKAAPRIPTDSSKETPLSRRCPPSCPEMRSYMRFRPGSIRKAVHTPPRNKRVNEETIPTKIKLTLSAPNGDLGSQVKASHMDIIKSSALFLSSHGPHAGAY